MSKLKKSKNEICMIQSQIEEILGHAHNLQVILGRLQTYKFLLNCDKYRKSFTAFVLSITMKNQLTTVCVCSIYFHSHLGQTYKIKRAL